MINQVFFPFEYRKAVENWTQAHPEKLDSPL